MKNVPKKLFIIVSLISLFAFLHCGGGEDKNSSGSGNVTVTLKSATLASRANLQSFRDSLPHGYLSRELTKLSRKDRVTSSSQGTAVTVDTGNCVTMAGVSYCSCTIANAAHGGTSINASGWCANPVEVGGGISSVSLYRAARMPARILGGGMELSTNKTGALDVSVFDLKDTSKLTGEDNLEDSSAATNWEGAQVYFSHIDVKVPPLTISGTTTYYTLRYLFYTQPLISETILANCGLDAASLATIKANSDFLAGLTFKRNDVMLCSKTAADECVNADFKFLDTSGSGSLVATRPSSESNVFKTSITDDSELNCKASGSGGGGADMNVGGMWMIGELSEQFNLTAQFGGGGSKTYELTSAAGVKTSGTKVKATLDFNMSNMIFIETGSGVALSTWLDASTLSERAQKVHFLPVYVRNQLDSIYEGSSYMITDSAFPVTATVTLE